MDEQLNSVNAGLENVVDSQTEPAAATATEPVDTGVKDAELAEQQPAETTKPQQSKDENAKFAEIRRNIEAKAAAEAEARIAQAKQAAKDEAAREIFGDEYPTWDAVQKARAEQARQAEIDRLVQQSFPREVAEELTELRQLRQQEQERAAQQAEKARREAENLDFLAYFKERNGREFTAEDAKNIPAEVFQNAKRDGVPMKYAYADHLAAQYEAKLKGIDKGKQTAEANAANATNSTGSVTGQGQAANSVLTEEMIAAMSPSQLAERWNDVKRTLNMK